MKKKVRNNKHGTILHLIGYRWICSNQGGLLGFFLIQNVCMELICKEIDFGMIRANTKKRMIIICKKLVLQHSINDVSNYNI